MKDITLDTTEELQYTRRIEYQLQHTQQQLQHETTAYYLTSFLPSISAFYSYVPEFENDKLSTLFRNAYPYSLLGLSVSLPIFQGFRRTENIHKSRLQEERLHWDEVELQLRINAEYEAALASYKSNLNSYIAMKSNIQLAREVYDVIRLQYREGIKQYLEVITAEADLRSSEINYLNALYQLLESKVTLQKALGDISPDI
jgi:outer membrane protein TolC